MSMELIDAFFEAEEGVVETENRGRAYCRRKKYLKEIRHNYVGMKNCRYDVIDGVAVAVYYKQYGKKNDKGAKRAANKAVRRITKTFNGIGNGNEYRKCFESYKISD